MIELIKDNLITIVIYGYIFLVGVGVGGMITETIWRWKPKKGENKDKRQH